MATPDMDVIKEIPGYKVILKAVLKAQIQQLIEQLAATTDEESVILTASVAEGTLSHLGSELAKGFLEDHEDVKSQFLGFCLKRQHQKQKEEEEKKRQQEMRNSMQQVTSPTYLGYSHGPMGSPGFLPRGPGTGFPIRRGMRSRGVRHEPYSQMPRQRAPSGSMPIPPLKTEPNEASNDSLNDSNNEYQSQSHSASSKDENQSNSVQSNESITGGSGSDNEQSGEFTRVKVESISESDLELEITGVELGRSLLSPDWDPNVSTGMGSGEDSQGQNKKFSENDIVWVKWKNWPQLPALVKHVYSAKKRVTCKLFYTHEDFGVGFKNVMLYCDAKKEEIMKSVEMMSEEHQSLFKQCVDAAEQYIAQQHGSAERSPNDGFITTPANQEIQERKADPRAGDRTRSRNRKTEQPALKSASNPIASHGTKSDKNQRIFCEVCYKEFANKQNLRRHRLIHTGEKRHECVLCQMHFTQKVKLRRHIHLEHEDKQPAPVNSGKSEQSALKSASKSIASSGKKSDKNQRIFCEVCDKNFAHKRSLKRHKLIHTGEKRHECILCKRLFTAKTNVTRHIRLIHKGFWNLRNGNKEPDSNKEAVADGNKQPSPVNSDEHRVQIKQEPTDSDMS